MKLSLFSSILAKKIINSDLRVMMHVAKFYCCYRKLKADEEGARTENKSRLKADVHVCLSYLIV